MNSFSISILSIEVRFALFIAEVATTFKRDGFFAFATRSSTITAFAAFFASHCAFAFSLGL